MKTAWYTLAAFALSLGSAAWALVPSHPAVIVSAVMFSAEFAWFLVEGRRA